MQSPDTIIADFLAEHGEWIRANVSKGIAAAMQSQKNLVRVEWVVQDTEEWTHPSPSRRYQHQPCVWGPGLYYPQASQIYAAQKVFDGDFTRQLLASVRDVVADSLTQDDTTFTLKPYDREYGPAIIDDPRDPNHEGYIFTDKQGDAFGIEVSFVVEQNTTSVTQ